MPENEKLRVYLSKVHLKGYKSIGDLSIDLKKGLNILIGKNGTGKSNFMEYLNLLTNPFAFSEVKFEHAHLTFLSDDDYEFAIEYERILRKHVPEDSNPNNRINLNTRFFINGKLEFDKSSLNSGPTKFKFNHRTFGFTDFRVNHFYLMGYDVFSPRFLKFKLPDNLYFISNSGTINIDIKSPFVEHPSSLRFIDFVMLNLETTFYQFEDEESESVQRKVRENELKSIFKVDTEIKSELKKYTPIEDIRFNPNINFYYEGDKLTIENLRIEFKINRNWLPWSQLSDGTRRLFYIITEVLYSGSLVLVEEPELGIHPHQFILLMDFLKEQSEKKQIIISTHSPKALDHFSEVELDNILIANYTTKKGTQIRHLTSKEQAKAKKYMKEVGFFSDYWMHSDLE